MVWVCSVCQAGQPAEASYASVLVFGTQDMQKVQEHEREVCSESPVANTTSYCVHCRRVTATFDAQLSTTANLILTHKLRLEYTRHKELQDSLPGKRQFRKLLRKTSRKHGGSIKPRL
jgi:3'-phosphoadenosine 5'-phosphosulfate sulfotransferase